MTDEGRMVRNIDDLIEAGLAQVHPDDQNKPEGEQRIIPTPQGEHVRSQLLAESPFVQADPD